MYVPGDDRPWSGDRRCSQSVGTVVNREGRQQFTPSGPEGLGRQLKAEDREAETPFSGGWGHVNFFLGFFGVGQEMSQMTDDKPDVGYVHRGKGARNREDTSLRLWVPGSSLPSNCLSFDCGSKSLSLTLRLKTSAE